MKDSDTAVGGFQLSKRIFKILKTLSDKAKTECEFHSNKNTLSVNLYGPCFLAESAGEFLQKCRRYLQMPEQCGRDVQYLNPHCLTPVDTKPIMTSVFNNMTNCEVDEQDCEDSNIFAELGGEEEFEEAPQPETILTTLRRYAIQLLSLQTITDQSMSSHQKQALTFLLGRERGWNLCGSRRDVWRSYTDRFGMTRYVA